MTSLFDPVRIGDIALTNRVVMAPLTRDRSDPDRNPTALNALYYRQRASAGLIISEGTQISPEGQGYIDTPGIYSEAQIAGWKQVTDAVHAEGGHIVAQIWHVGRISHDSLPPGTQPVSSTTRPANTKTFTRQGFEAASTPRVLGLDEIPRLIEDYRHAARSARAAGFDGVEIHSANNYLLEQFLRSSTNERTDAYGGSVENRGRLVLEVAQAVAEAIGAGRTGIRLSPVTPVNDGGQDADATALYSHVVDGLAKLKLAFVHVIEGQTGGARDVAPFDFEALRLRWKAVHPDGAWIVNNGYTRQMALDVVAEGRADAVAFGKAFISNPDLVHRLQVDAPLAAPNPKTFYGGGAEGYTDYPALETTPPDGIRGAHAPDARMPDDLASTPLSDLPLARWLTDLLALAREAGAVTLHWYTPDCARMDKADGSPVTAADAAAEAVITAGLQRLAPGIPIVAEEAMSCGEGPAAVGSRFWLVDPLDGTREFLARNGEFTVNIALIDDGMPVLGVVGAPALGRWWCGAAGLGARVVDDAGGAPHPITVREVPSVGLTVLGSRSHADASAMDHYLAGRRVAAFEPAGSSLKFCRIAEGRADLYPRFGRTMEWDTAAGHAVLAAAGGAVSMLDGAPLRYGKPGHENPHFVASGAASAR